MSALCLRLCVILFSALAHAQFVSVGGGGVFSQDRSNGRAAVQFSKTGIITADAGIGVLPFIALGGHYSFSRPEMTVTADAFRSRAVAELKANTVTLDARLRTPQAAGTRLYAFAGAGFTHFGFTFPGGVASPVTSPVFTFGGGAEFRLAPLIRWKLEVRDYLTGLSDRFYQPGGTFHRVALTAGLVLGR